MPIDVEAMYRRYGPMVVRRCRRLLKDEDLAMDAAQDVFVRLVRKQDELADERPAGLLMRMATRVCLNVLRSRRSRPEDAESELLSEIAGRDDGEASLLARLGIARLFEHERPSTRVMAVLHYVDGLTLEQTAREVGLSVSGVRKRLRGLRVRARALEDA